MSGSLDHILLYEVCAPPHTRNPHLHFVISAFKVHEAKPDKHAEKARVCLLPLALMAND